jgi:hypothetical protein
VSLRCLYTCNALPQIRQSFPKRFLDGKISGSLRRAKLDIGTKALVLDSQLNVEPDHILSLAWIKRATRAQVVVSLAEESDAALRFGGKLVSANVLTDRGVAPLALLSDSELLNPAVPSLSPAEVLASISMDATAFVAVLAAKNPVKVDV